MGDDLSKRYEEWKAKKVQTSQKPGEGSGLDIHEELKKKLSQKPADKKVELKADDKKVTAKKEEKVEKKKQDDKASADKKKEKLKKKAKAKKDKAIKVDVLKALRKKKRVVISKRKQLRFFLDKAGYEEVDDVKVKKLMLYRIPLIVCSILAAISLAVGLFLGSNLLYVLFFVIVGVFMVCYGVVLIIEFLTVYVFLDFKTYQRKKQMESVLADFLQLASANISAGMPIDQALWFAVRPKFGVLAKEIEQVAKSTMTGEDLAKALKTFAAKYDSVVLTRSISLLLEGMEGGGEIADLLNKISLNIQETRIMKKEMAADVLTYVIFISFATVIISPFLFALATQLLYVVTSITGNIDTAGTSSMFSFSGQAIDIADFKIFVYSMLGLSGLFSALIIAVIRSGNPREGLRYIPVFWAVSLVIYLIGNLIIGSMLGAVLYA